MTREFAENLSLALGGAPDNWLSLYERAINDETINVEEALLQFPRVKLNSNVNVTLAARRLVNFEIYNLFADDGDLISFKPYIEMAGGLDGESACIIEPFDASRIQKTSYDLRIGHYLRPQVGAEVGGDDLSKKPDRMDPRWLPLNSSLVIAKDEVLLLRSLEKVELASFAEADIAAPHSLSLKLDTGGGPIIDPCFANSLTLRVRNSNPFPVMISPEEAFLTLRFTLLPVLPRHEFGLVG